MAEFDNLTSLYNRLETCAADYPGAHRISSLFQVVYNKLKEDESKRNEADRALCEYRFFALRFTAGAVENWCDHITASFDSQTYTYAAERLRSTQNPVLRARYAHILWCSSNKNIDHARDAIDSYIQTAKTYEREDRKETHGWCGFEVSIAIRNAYGLAIRTQYRITEVKTELLRLIRHFNPKSRWSFRVRQELIKVILEDRRQFGISELAGLQDVCWRLAGVGMKSRTEASIQEAKDMLALGKKIDQRLKQQSHNWSLRIGKCYENLTQLRQEGDNAIPFFYLNAIKEYKKAGKTVKARSLEQQYGKLAGSIRLGNSTVRIDQTEVVKRSRELAEKVTKLRAEEVIQYIVNQQELLPRYADIKQRVSARSIEPILMDMASTTIDDHGHASQHFSSVDERLYRERVRIFAQQLTCYKLPIINQVLLTAIEKRKFSTETFMDYIREKSWLGKELCRESPRAGTLKYRWSQLLEPSLSGYFNKMLEWLTNGTLAPNLILEIDSLTLKFEGVLRDLLRITAVPTFRQKPDRKGRTTTEEKDVGALLYDENVGSLFDENELFFFRFLLVEKSGYNLRARIAHSLMLAADYHLDYMHLMVLALLKLAKYDLAQNNEIVASRAGSTFHLANCMLVRRILAKNRIVLPNSKAASRKGYAACRVCKPEHSEPANHPRVNTSRTQHILVVRS